jgi:tetratricopeptide (TPR) repeat protein
VQAITDFQEALKKDPTNKELCALLAKAKDKYREVEGREFGSAPHQSVKHAKQEDITTVVAVRAVGMAEALLLPQTHKTVISSGVLQRVSDEEEGEQCGFTRIQIQDTDSDDDGEEEEEEGVEGVEQGFTRIAITTSDDDEEDEEEDAEGAKPLVAAASAASTGDGKSEQFTRITISMDSDSDSESDGENEAAALEEAIALKNKGNAAMQKGDFAGAIAAYTASLSKCPQGENSTAVHCNRSLTHIKMEVREK